MKNFHSWFKSKRIGVLMGGTSAERPISIKTGTAIYKSLKRQGCVVTAIDAGKSLPETLKKNKINFAYIALHGPRGEDGVVQGLLEWLQIPCTGSGVLASAMAMNKITSKRLFDAERLPSAPWYFLNRPSPLVGEGKGGGTRLHDCPPSRVAGATTAFPHKGGRESQLGYPVVVKPARQGSAVGVSIVKRASEWPAALMNAFRYDTQVVVEKFLRGPEITVGVLGDQALPIIEILPQHDRPFYDFHAKYSPGGSRHILPARLSASVARRSKELSLKACQALGTRGAARVDLIVDQRLGPCLLEVNTIPGMTETSLLPEAARAAGIDFDALVLKIAELSFGS
jgi:D-alanine-D-alanine ligase